MRGARRFGDGHADDRHQGVPVRFTPPRDRRVNARVVPCPSCEVGVGESCVTAAGTPLRSGSHLTRRRMAIRKENEDNG